MGLRAAAPALGLLLCAAADALSLSALEAGDECAGGRCALSALQRGSGVFKRASSSSQCGRFAPHHETMDCGAGVPLCGVLVLETGRGTGAYRHREPVVHGLWPQVGNYGNSRCLAPVNSAEPTSLSSCYHQEGGSQGQLLGFQRHEWSRHGVCAGASSAQDYFGQVCSLASGPLRVMSSAKAANLDLVETAEALQRAGYCVWKTDTHAQVELSACAGQDGRWKLAGAADFGRVCGSSAPAPAPIPIPAPAPPSGGVCLRGKHGPACHSDADCSGASNCLRCARSGFCTDVPK